MTLLDVVRQLEQFDEDDVIRAIDPEPWTRNSECVVMRRGDPRSRSLYDVVSVWMAREFLDGWQENVDRELTAEERCDRLIQYSINDG